jgi:hypothetical protein
MAALLGTIQHGQIVLDRPSELPDGTRVEVLPVEAAWPSLGMREEDWPTTSEGIAALLERMDQREADWLSPEDEASWREGLRAQREFDKSRFFTEGEKLGEMFE